MGVISSSGQRKIGVVLQYIQMALSIAVQLVYTPIMLRTLGATEYGIYNVASSTISFLSLVSFGFGSSYVRYYSLYAKDNKNDEIKRMNGLYLAIFLFMGLIALAAGMFLTGNVQWFYNETYTSSDIEIARVLMLILTINIAISFPASVFVSYITSQERFIFQKVANIGKTVIAPVANIVLLYCGYGSVGLVVATTCISLLVDGVNIWYCLGKLKMRISFKNPDFKLLKEIFIFSFFIGINQLIDQINWQTDKVVLSKVVNGTAVAVYAVGAVINTMYLHFSTAISSVFAPKVNKIVSRNDENMDEELTSLFIRVGRVQWFVVALVLSGFIFFGKYFVTIWAGEEYLNSYYVALLLICPVTIPLIQNIGIEIQRAKNKHQFRSVVYLIMALLNVGISIWFAYMWGEIGVALGTTISLLVANGLIMNIYYHKKLGINIIEFWKSIISTLPGLVIPVAGGVCLMLFYKFNSLLDFCLLIVAYAVIYAVSSYFLGLNREEKNMVNSLGRKIFRIK